MFFTLNWIKPKIYRWKAFYINSSPTPLQSSKRKIFQLYTLKAQRKHFVLLPRPSLSQLQRISYLLLLPTPAKQNYIQWVSIFRGSPQSNQMQESTSSSSCYLFLISTLVALQLRHTGEFPESIRRVSCLEW